MSTRKQSQAARINEYFVPKQGIDRSVITADIYRYLGNDALVRPGSYENPGTGEIQHGYFITSTSNLTVAHIADIKADNERWEAERRVMMSRGQPSNFEYHESMTHQSRQYYGPTSEVNMLSSYSQSNSYPYSPAVYNSQPASPPSLPILPHLKPNRKDLPLLLNGTACRACADFGASANVINSKFAQELDLVIDSVTPCPAFELPTFKKLLRPSGRVSVTCEFPGEPESRIVEVFFVIENFVHSVVMGRRFLRQTRTIDKFRNRLRDKLLQVHEIPVVASLGGQDEILKFWLDGQELMSTPDTGSEINVMSLSFAKQRGFAIKEDTVHQVRFADSSLQDVEGVVSVPVSFGNGLPPSLLLKLVDPDPRNYSPTVVRTGNAPEEIDRPIEYGATVSILADFHILAGLKVDIIFGEDLLATVNAFVRHSTDFDDTASSLPESPSLATMGLVKKAGKLVCSALGKQTAQSKIIDLEQARDIADSKELDRYEREKLAIGKLVGDKKASAERRNERKRKEYNENRRVLATPSVS